MQLFIIPRSFEHGRCGIHDFISAVSMDSDSQNIAVDNFDPFSLYALLGEIILRL